VKSFVRLSIVLYKMLSLSVWMVGLLDSEGNLSCRPHPALTLGNLWKQRSPYSLVSVQLSILNTRMWCDASKPSYPWLFYFCFIQSSQLNWQFTKISEIRIIKRDNSRIVVYVSNSSIPGIDYQVITWHILVHYIFYVVNMYVIWCIGNTKRNK
jgi:hypothetical protein